MSAVVTVVVPVFGVVALGFAAVRAGLFAAEAGAALARFMYYFAVPALLFRGIAQADLPAAPPWTVLAMFYLPALSLFAGMAALAPRTLGWARSERGLAAMSASYGNIVLLGYPLVHAAFGSAGALPLLLIMGTQSLVMFPLTTLLLERERTRGRGLHALLDLARNPVVVSLLAGFVCNASGTAVPVLLDRALELLSAAGPGCALVALGMSLARYRLDGGYRDVLVFVAVKNILNPILAGGLGFALGLRGDVYTVVLMLAAMPVGINAFVFASQYGLRQDAVAKAIVVSTVVSAGTVGALLAVLPPG